jgi:hypothetical protein
MRSETKLPPLTPSASAARDIADDSDCDASSSGLPSSDPEVANPYKDHVPKQ